MKILIAGTKWHDDSIKLIVGGFQSQGSTVELFDDGWRNFSYTMHRILERTPFRKFSNYQFDAYRKKIGQRLILKVAEFRPDFIFGRASHFLPETVKEIRDRFNTSFANWIIDDPMLYEKTLLYELSFYSHIFIIDKLWMEYVKFFNPATFYLPQVGDKYDFKPLQLKKDIDVSFAGSMSMGPPDTSSGFLRARIINSLAVACPHLKITAFSPGIKNFFQYYPELKNIDFYDGYKDHTETNKLYNRSKIVLSMHSPQFKSDLSQRVFDAAMSGSFQLVEYKSEAKHLFPQGIILFKSISELLDLVDFYLSHEQEREEVARQMYFTAITHHSFEHRARDVIKTIFNE